MLKFQLVVGAVLCLFARSAVAGPQGQVQLDFSEAGVATAYSALFAPGQDFSFTEAYGGYSLLVTGETGGPDDVTGDPFLSLAIQVTNVGRPAPAPLTVGFSMTGLPASGDAYVLDSSATSIFHTASTAAFSTFYDTGDTLFGQGSPLSSFLLNRTANSFDEVLGAALGADYAISMFYTLDPAANAHPTLDGQLTSEDVPEPGSLPLLAAGLSVPFGLRWRRRPS